VTVQDFETYDVLALQVEQPPAAGQLKNLVANPSGVLGGWGWITPVAGTTMQGGDRRPAELHEPEPERAVVLFHREHADHGRPVRSRPCCRCTAPARRPMNVRLRFDWIHDQPGAGIGSSAVFGRPERGRLDRRSRCRRARRRQDHTRTAARRGMGQQRRNDREPAGRQRVQLHERHRRGRVEQRPRSPASRSSPRAG
jgi:hypothetical protein